MMRSVLFYTLALFAALSTGGAMAQSNALRAVEVAIDKKACAETGERCPRRAEKKKPKKIAPAKPKRSPAKKSPQKKPKPIEKVKPRIPKEYVPPRSAGAKLEEIIAVYKSCMYDGDENDRIDRALARNLAPRNDDALGGSPERLGNEVCLADAIGLKRYETLSDVETASNAGELAEVTAHPAMEIADDLPGERRYARPWVRDYLRELSDAMAREFKGKEYTPLRVGSLVRTFKDQLRQYNSPASCRTEICSTHTTGAAVDLSNNPFRIGRKERLWLRKRLLEDRKAGKIIVIEERFPPHFHMLVLPPQFVSETGTDGRKAGERSDVQ